MTHLYVIALNGHIEPAEPGEEATAVGWAADAVLAVGPDELVRAISRGDSTFLDLRGCVVTPLPADPAAADALVRGTARPGTGIGRLLLEAGLLAPDAAIEPGAPADLAFWEAQEETGPRLVAKVRGGHFTEGDEHRGPFPRPDAGGAATGPG